MAPASQMAWMAVTSCREVGPEEGDVVARLHAEGLEVGGVAAGLLVELGVGHGDVLAADHEGERCGRGRRRARAAR